MVVENAAPIDLKDALLPDILLPMKILHAAERPFAHLAALHELCLVAINERAAHTQRDPIIVFGR